MFWRESVWFTCTYATIRRSYTGGLQCIFSVHQKSKMYAEQRKAKQLLIRQKKFGIIFKKNNIFGNNVKINLKNVCLRNCHLLFGKIIFKRTASSDPTRGRISLFYTGMFLKTYRRALNFIFVLAWTVVIGHGLLRLLFASFLEFRLKVLIVFFGS